MKYLFAIAVIVGTVLVLSLFFLLPEEKPSVENVALTINGQQIGENQILQQAKRYGYHSEDTAELHESIITRRILINEAQRLQIDKEESFRKALKEWYENSLINILLDRQNEKLEATVSEGDIDNYISLLGKKVTFTRLEEVPDSASNASSIQGTSNSAIFDDLASSVRILLSTLTVGEFGIKYDTGSDKFAIRLDAVDTSEEISGADIDRQKIKEMIGDYKREQLMNDWLAQLRSDAQITIHQDGKSQ